jgi:HME family heavy-metal exporter
MDFAGWLLALTWVMVAFAAWQLANLGRNFLPQFDEGSIQVNVSCFSWNWKVGPVGLA